MDIPNILNLRQVLREKFPEAHRASLDGRGDGPEEGRRVLEVGVPSLDAIGVPRGAITEVHAACRGCGTGLVIAGVLERTARHGGFTALVDGRDSFDPGSVAPSALGPGCSGFSGPMARVCRTTTSWRNMSHLLPPVFMPATAR